MADKLEPIGVVAIAEGVDKFISNMHAMERSYDKTVGALTTKSGEAVGGTKMLGMAFSALMPNVAGAVGSVAGFTSVLGPIGAVAGVALGALSLLKKGFDTLMEAIKATISAIISFVSEGMQLAGRFQEMEISALAVGRSMGLQEEQIRGAIETYKDLGIRTDVAAKAAASFAKNQIDLAKASELVRVAQGAAILLGEDSSATMERLTWAVTTQNTRMMRYMGIMVDFQAAQERFAKANDRDADSLTQVEKNMIAVNEAIRAGASIAGIYEEAMASPTKAMRSLTEREIPELKAAIGAPFLQAWATVVNSVREFVKALGGAVIEGGALYPVLVNLGAIASILADAFAAGLDYVTEFVQNLQTDLGQGMGDLATEMLRWGAEIVASLAEGIVQATSTVLVAAMNAVGGVLGFWLGPGSPPRVAPGLVKWGVSAMSEFLHGMTEADFGVLEKIQAPLKQILGGKQFADISAEMIKALSEGAFDEKMFARIEEAAGKFGTEIAQLARLQYDLAMANQAVADSEKRVEEGRQKVSDLTAEYNQMVRAGADPAALKAKLAEINAAEEGLEVAKAQRTEAKERIGSLEDEAKLQEKIVGQLIGMAKAAAPPTAAAAAVAAARMPKAAKAEAISPEDILPTPAAFDITSRINEAIDKAKAAIQERLAYIFEPLVTKWEETIKPTLLTLGVKFVEFSTKVTEVYDKIKGFFLPLLTEFWMFVTSQLVPKLTELARTTMEALKRAVDAVKRAFGWLLSKIKELWSWVTETFIPWVEEKFIVALDAIRDIVDRIRGAFERVIEVAQKLINKLDDLIQKAKEAARAVKAFLPGSPSPFEAGLLGAAKAMRQLSAVELPRLSAAMTPLPAYGASPVMAGATTTTTSVTVPITANIYGEADMSTFQLRVEQAVARAVYGRP